MAKRTPIQQRATRTTLVPITVPMTFSGIAAMTGVPAYAVANRYHALKAQGRRKIGLPDLIADYKPRARRTTK